MIYYDINGLPINEKGNLVISAGTPGNTQIATPADYASRPGGPPAYIPDTNTIINNTRSSSAFQGVETTMGGQRITEGKQVPGAAEPTAIMPGADAYVRSTSYTSTGSPGSYTSTGQKPAAYDGSGYYSNVGTPESNTPDYSLNYMQGPAGEAYNAAMKQIAADLGTRPTYDNKYDLQLQEAYQNIVGRDPFSWNADQDPFYQDYARRYTQLGQQAMKDTMGQAAALTGGYGNTYAQFAGQGAYNQYMAALADKQIELEERAYQRYQDAGDELYRQYSMLGDLRDTEYGRYRDAVSDYNYNLALMQAQEAEDYQRAVYNNNLRIQAEQEGYGRYRDALNDARYQDELGYSRYRDALSDYRYEDELSYSRWRDAVSDSRYEDELAYQRYRDSVGDDRWQQEFNLKQTSAASSGSSGGSGRSSGGGTYNGGPLDGQSYGSGAPDWFTNMGETQRKEFQRTIGTDPDGIWGPKTQAAYEAYMNSTGPATYMNSGNNGYDYSLNGYTGEQIYSSLAEEAKQAKYEADMLDKYVKFR